MLFLTQLYMEKKICSTFHKVFLSPSYIKCFNTIFNDVTM